MPNYVYQKIIISDYNYSERFKDLKKKIINEDGYFDFNLLIPQPENIFKGPLGDEERRMCIEQNKPNWYDWNKDNWNTKWNACNTEIIRNDDDTLEFKFSTAWNTPDPIIKKILELSKGFYFKYVAVEEGFWFAYDITKTQDDIKKTTDLKDYCDTLMFLI